MLGVKFGGVFDKCFKVIFHNYVIIFLGIK